MFATRRLATRKWLGRRRRRRVSLLSHLNVESSRIVPKTCPETHPRARATTGFVASFRVWSIFEQINNRREQIVEIERVRLSTFVRIPTRRYQTVREVTRYPRRRTITKTTTTTTTTTIFFYRRHRHHYYYSLLSLSFSTRNPSPFYGVYAYARFHLTLRGANKILHRQRRG